MKPVLCFIVTLCALIPSASARADTPTCAASRLRVGMSAVIAPWVGSLNLRALPAVSTGVIRRLSARTPVAVLAGPACNKRYAWWRIETSDGARGWVAEGDWESYFVIPARDLQLRRTPAPFEWSCPPLQPRRCPQPF